MIIRTFGEIYFNYKLLRHFSTMINSFETLFEARERKFQQERLFRGESVDLVARITTDGVLDNLSSYAISGVYQAVDDPDGHIYSINSEITNGKAILHWTDENDFGKNAYNVWGLLTKDGKAAYPIAWRLNFAHSPSYPLSAIDPLVRTIDFDNYDLLNAPWLPLSGDTMYENSFIRFPVDEDTSIQFDKDGIEKLSATTLTTEPMSGYCWHTIIDPVPDYEIQWFTESELANWNYEESIPPWQNSRLRLCATKPAETHTDVSTIVNLSVPNDEEGDRTIATREWAQENTDEKLNDYLPLSGGVVTGSLSAIGSFQSSNFKADSGVGIMIGYNAKAKTGSIAIGSSSDVTNAHFGSSNVAIGTAAKIGSTSQTDCAVAVGIGTTVNGNYGIAIGHAAAAEGANSIAIGSSGSRVQALAPESIQIGGLSNGLWTPNNTPHSLKVFDKMVLSGDNLTLDPERIPYLNDYQTKSDAAAEHTQLSNDLTAWVEEQLPEPTGPLAPLTIKQNGQTLVEYRPDGNTPQEATITVPTKVSDLEGSEDLVNQDGLSSVLSDYATNSFVNDSFNNARYYTDEQIDQLSDVYVKKDNIDFLSTDYAGLPDLNNISLFDISHKLNFCIQAISGKKIPIGGDLPPDAEYTYVVMADGTQLLDDGTELSNIQEGTLDAFARHNGYSGANDIRAVVLGSEVEALGHHAFAAFENLEMVDISRAQITLVEDRTFQYSPRLRYVDLGTSISAIGSTVFQHSDNLTELTLPESLVTTSIWSFNNGGIKKLIFTGRTKAQVQAMSNYPWQMGGCTMVATDETWIA